MVVKHNKRQYSTHLSSVHQLQFSPL